MRVDLDLTSTSTAKNQRALRYLDADLTASKRFKNFNITRFQFKLSKGSALELNIERESDATEVQKRQVIDDLTALFMSVLAKVKEKGAKDSDHIHIYVSASGQSFKFAYNKNIREGATLQQMMNTEDDVMEKVLLGFSDVIQSGNDVTLDDKTKIEVYTYSVPTGGMRVRTGQRDKVMTNLRSVLHTGNPNDDTNLCFPQALYLCSLELGGKEYKNMMIQINKARKAGRSPPERLLNNARQMLLEVMLLGCSELRYKHPVPLSAVRYFAQHLNANIHIYTFSKSGSKGEFIHHAQIPGSDKHIHVLFDPEVGHYDPIVNPLKFLRTVHNNQHRRFCSKCFCSVDSRYHTVCESYDPNAPVNVEESSRTIKRYKPDKGQLDTTTEFIQQPKEKGAFNEKIIFFDFETQVIGYHRETDEEEEVQPYTSSSPPPFEKRVLHADYDYKQVVVYGAWKDHQDNEGDFHSIDEFMAMLDDPEFAKATLVAHNGGGFDFQLMLEYYYSQDVLRLGGDKPIVMKGSRIIMAEIVNGIRLIDFYAFVSQPLAALPSMFDLPDGLSKGYYPYCLDQKKYEDYKGDWPSVEWYEPDLKKPKARDDLLKWHEQKVASGEPFDLKEQRIAYCKDDVEIGIRALLKFCDIMQSLETPDGRNIGAHPLHYTTAAGMAFKGVFLTHFMNPNEIAVVKPATKENFSWKSVAWLNHVMATEEVIIHHALNGGEKRIYCPSLGKAVKVDGYDPTNGVAYEFHGCHWHGCPRHTREHAPVPGRKRKYFNRQKDKEVEVDIKYGNLLSATREKDAALRASHEVIKLVVIWECEFDAMKIPMDREQLNHCIPLQPREGYRGGRTSNCKLYFKCKGEEKIFYDDIVSMYPAVMRNENNAYPIGQVKIFKKGDGQQLPELEQLFGLVKAKVTPPEDLYFPVLPSTSESGKVVFSCEPHQVGVWPTPELLVALDLGYKIEEIYEVHHFEKSSKNLFQEYIDVFFEMKDRASREKNSGLKATVKVLLNVLYGRFGYNAAKASTTRHVSDSTALFKHMSGTYQGITMDVINEDNMLLHLQDNNENTIHRESNVYIAAFVTCYARLQLFNESLHSFGRQVLYYDTDSVIYFSKNGHSLQKPELLGKELGKWESELDEQMIDGSVQQDWFTEFVSTAPKTYGLKSRSGNNDMLKCKGFSLHHLNQKIMNFETLKTQAEGMAKQVSTTELEELCLHKNETKMEKKFFRIQVKENKGKVMHRNFDKRDILPPLYSSDGELRMIDSIPWGFKGEKMELDNAYEMEDHAMDMMSNLTQVIDFEL